MEAKITCKRVVDLSVEQRETLLTQFENSRNPGLVDVLRTHWRDTSSAMYYIVYCDRVPLFFFSLRVSSLFSEQVKYSSEEVACAKKITHLAAVKNFDFTNQADLVQFKQVLQYTGMVSNDISFAEFVKKLSNMDYIGLYAYELKSQDSFAIFQSVFPCMEIVEFCKCTSAAACLTWHDCGVNAKLGEFVFYMYISPILHKMCNDVGCSMLMLYAADNTSAHTLVQYYRTALHLDYPGNIMAVKPAYDMNCPLLVQKVDVIFRDTKVFATQVSADVDRLKSDCGICADVQRTDLFSLLN